MINLESIYNVEINEKNIEKESIKVNESFYDYDDCLKNENDTQKEIVDTYDDCVKTIFDIEEEKRKLEELRTMFEDCGLIDSNNRKK